MATGGGEAEGGLETRSVPTEATFISDDWPTPADYNKTTELVRVLRDQGCYVSEQETEQRQAILKSLDELVKEWIFNFSTGDFRTNRSQIPGQDVGGMVVAYGSFQLGVYDRDSDLDCLCIAPRNIRRIDFFGSLARKLSEHDGISELRLVENSFVPVIKMKFNGINIDLLFAGLSATAVTNELELNADNVLRNLDTRCLRSLSGYRVGCELNKLVPMHNTYGFRRALRCVRLWAKRKGIYSSCLGYLGGVSWTILMIRVCQLYPNAAASTLVLKFFTLYSQWKWPIPVLVKKMNRNHNPQLSAWDAQCNRIDALDLMPILTPAYPEANSARNVTKASLSILTKSLKEGLNTWEEILAGSLSMSTMFEPFNFFRVYRKFIVIDASAKTHKEFLEWSGLVESRLIRLTKVFDTHPLIECYRLWTANYDCGPPTVSSYHRRWLIGVKLNSTGPGVVNLNYESCEFQEMVFENAAHRPGMQVGLHFVKRRHLDQYIPADLIGRKKLSKGKGSRDLNQDDENTQPRGRRDDGDGGGPGAFAV